MDFSCPSGLGGDHLPVVCDQYLRALSRNGPGGLHRYYRICGEQQPGQDKRYPGQFRSGTGAFTSSITGLTPLTKYYVRAYATNSKGTGYGQEESFTTQLPSGSTVTDIDGNVYRIVQIGEQVWMAENLKVTRYADGGTIPYVESSSDWNSLGDDDRAYCWYDNSTENRDRYGGLYTWTAAANENTGSDDNPSGLQGVCPDGWHLPSNSEWKELEMYLGMSQEDADDTGWRGTDQGEKLKELGYDHWESPNLGATDESGFSALPSGHRGVYGSFADIGTDANFWTASEGNLSSFVWFRGLSSTEDKVASRNDIFKQYGFSVRCVRGAGSFVTIPTVSTSPSSTSESTTAILYGEVTGDGGGMVTDRGFYYGPSTDPVSTGTQVSEGSGTGRDPVMPIPAGSREYAPRAGTFPVMRSGRRWRSSLG